jgi:hypothetical protein
MPDIHLKRSGPKYQRLESLIKELGHADPFYVIFILGNALTDLTFEVTGEGNRGGAA